MATTPGFWPALERGPLGPATPAEWRHRLGDAFGAARRFLRPTGLRAEAVPEFDDAGGVRHFRVVEHDAGDLVGIDDRTGDRRALRDEERVVLAFDAAALAGTVRMSMGFRRLSEERADDSLHLVGGAGPDGAGRRAYLVLPGREPFIRAVHALIASSAGPCLLLVPTRACLGRDAATKLAAHRIDVVVLDEALEIDDAGGIRRPTRPPATPHVAPAGRPYSFRRAGDVWTLAYAGKATQRVDSVGLGYVHRLLATPNRAISALVLVGAEPGAASDGRQPVLDERTLAEVNRQIREMDEEIAEAERDNDGGRIDGLREERGRLLAQVTPLLGKGGKARGFADAAGRARRSVGMAITRAIKDIRKDLPELARHLRTAIQGGSEPTYAPPEPLDWDL